MRSVRMVGAGGQYAAESPAASVEELVVRNEIRSGL